MNLFAVKFPCLQLYKIIGFKTIKRDLFRRLQLVKNKIDSFKREMIWLLKFSMFF